MRAWVVGLVGFGCGILCVVISIMAFVVFADEWLRKAQR